MKTLLYQMKSILLFVNGTCITFNAVMLSNAVINLLLQIFMCTLNVYIILHYEILRFISELLISKLIGI